MKRIFYFITIILLFIGLSNISFVSLSIYAAEENYDAVYFGSSFCTNCQALIETDQAFERLEAQGLTIKKYLVEDDKENTRIFQNYKYTFDVPLNKGSIPIIFVGDRYFSGREDINVAIDNFEIRDIAASTPMIEILMAPPSDFSSMIYFILLAFLDGVNPCAIAMLILFISLLGFTKRKKVLIPVALTFILAIFLTYFLLGTILFQFLSQFRFLSFFVVVLPWVVIGISGLLFLLNFYDFIVTILRKYNLVKNQLPKGIQKFNRRLMEKFTKKMDEGSKMIYVITFFIGMIISLTEFLCTGQAYLPAILHLIHFTNSVFTGLLLLVIYNIIFVLPLIVITIIAHKTQSIQSISVFMREKLHWIKLFNALVFLAILLYYVFAVI